MENKNRLLYGIVSILLVGVLISSYFIFLYSPYKFHGEGPIKIFYLNSFNSENFPLTQKNIVAFKKVFEDAGIEIEIKQFDMDVIRNPSNESKENAANTARAMIEEYKPDMIYATDDAAQELVAVEYINTNIPIVFSGVNEDPKKYGYDKAKNVAGVLERVHFVSAIDFARILYPEIKKIGVVGADYYLWKEVIERMKSEASAFPDINFVGWDLFYNYSDYQNKVIDYQNKVDALILLGLEGMKYSDGNNVPGNVFAKWTVENNKLPEITFWDFNVAAGNLLSVDVSATEQGKAAGNLAKKILIDGAKPSSFKFESTSNGVKNINLKRAEQLELKKEDIPSAILINSNIYENYSWENKNE